MIALLISALVLSILTVASFIAFILIDKKHDKLRAFIFVLTVLMMISNSILIAVIASMIKDKPTAMDVYQSKTTLKYTVVDSVITDSTVVFRKEDL